MASNTLQAHLAKNLIDDYLRRTGIIDQNGDLKRRYLWTDAYAIRTLFALSQFYDDTYTSYAVDIVDQVHRILGKFRDDDHRKGWISGLPEKEGKIHPTSRGLRIGKHMPERQPDEPFDQQLEWERDGQYFHYNSQWILTLLQCYHETSQYQYLKWATEMTKACEKFIYCNAEPAGMYWKMSTDLTRPLVRSMGAHDPLEGLIACESILAIDEGKKTEIEDLKNQFEYLCQSKNWTTTDPLGLGILLNNIHQSVAILEVKGEVPAPMHPRKLLDECFFGLESVVNQFNTSTEANRRLAFRECGLSHGLRRVWHNKALIRKYVPVVDAMDRFIHLADEIENFWSKEEHRQGPTWTDHLDINAVMLAASLAAKD